MKKRFIVFIVLLIIVVIVAYKGIFNYKEYQEIVTSEKEHIFSNGYCSFSLQIKSDSDYKKGESLFNSIQSIKESTINEFLEKDEKMVFKPHNLDTITMKFPNNGKFDSSLNLGKLDNEFNVLLVENIIESLGSFENIKWLKVITETPTKYDGIPLPNGVLNNVESSNDNIEW